MGKYGDKLNELINVDANDIHIGDLATLSQLAVHTLAENDLSERIGQPGVPLADALQDCEFDDDEIETHENDGSGMRRFGRVIVSWDSHNFRAAEVFHSVKAATDMFDEYRKFYPHDED